LKNFIFALFVCLSLTAVVQAEAADYYVEAKGDTMIVHLKPGKTGITIDPEDVQFNDGFKHWVDLANKAQAYFNVVVSNDDSKWALLQILEQDPKFGPVDFDEMQLNYDSLSQGGRHTAADQILTLAGLKLEAQINLRFVRDKTCYFKIYGVKYGENPTAVIGAPGYGTSAKVLSVDNDVSPLALPVPFAPRIKFTVRGGTPPYRTEIKFDQRLISKTTTDTTYTVDSVGEHKIELMVVDAANDTLLVEQKVYGLKGNRHLRFGVESTFVGDGRPVTVITGDLELDCGDWLLVGTGGYLPQNDEDQRFGALSLAHLPGNNRFGPVARLIYASRNLTVNGGYLQEGYGPTVGLMFRNQDMTVYLTGGLQYFDRQRQSRRGELTLNLGVKIHTLNF